MTALKIVLDTNALLRSIARRSSFAIVLDKLYDGDYELWVSNDILLEYEEKIIDIFSSQALDPRNATRHSIGRILLYEFDKLERYLGRTPTKKDVDHYNLLNSSLYIQVFGRWSNFEEMYMSRKR